MHRYLNFTTRSVVWFLRASQNAELEFHAPFQRNPVWTVKQQASLIETILLEYPIPELYMQTLVSSQGAEEHVVVDGQQRLRAVLEYLAGKFPLADDAQRGASSSFDELTAEDKKRLFEYVFVVRQLPEMPDDELRAIFQRINRNTVTLNAQELRHATYYGKFIGIIELIAEYAQWDEVGVFSANDRKRMLDAEYVSEIVIAYLHGLQNKKSSLEKFYRAYETEFDRAEEVVTVFRRVLDEIVGVLPDLRHTRWKKKSDFYTLFLAFSSKAANLPLASDVRAAVAGTLLRFASDVDAWLVNQVPEDDEVGEQLPMEVQVADTDAIAKYALSVSRAASDLANRKRRQEVLGELLSAVW
ncbi:DUF262 domain-containing protein [Lysobacter sp. M2-1]|uniref:GmrSD restriction endonuclease domain-containing protein n=1 Tax=Lysobacter sp. M2-1 TaxID=2916839 RepID=UPI001F586E25|nr:DUF262 domain-containing protein [Lysobacter sp. M2-1]